MSIQIITYATLPCIRYETFEITSAIDLCNEEKSISKMDGGPAWTRTTDLSLIRTAL